MQDYLITFNLIITVFWHINCFLYYINNLTRAAVFTLAQGITTNENF